MTESCKARVGPHLKGRIADLETLFCLYQAGDEEGTEELGTFPEYGLCFDYVAPATFTGQRRGYFRYQLSWGGPSDEFRFFADERLNPTSIEYWFMDWGDGAKVKLMGKALTLLTDIFEEFKDSGTVQDLLDKA